MAIDKSLIRIELDSIDKQLIHKYWYMASKAMQEQLQNNNYIDITRYEIEGLVGYLSLECNHTKSKKLASDLDELCNMLECYLNP